ncbi:MAG TPA: nucleotidyltransferase domain-containing protein [archaeon]|nr:nucleotidyltransferase domain-containing protein [Candidatus Nanoarchaeia archaeon]HLD84986.1 nucleotidyltransferase domain-containing protein [archaeon]
MISQIFDANSFKVIALFALSPGSRFKRKEIQGKTMMNNVPLDKALSRLISSGIIKKENSLFSINFENRDAEKIVEIAVTQYKQMKSLPFDVYLLLLDVVHEISSFKTEAWLFGSYSKLVYNEKSDIDLSFLTEENFNKNTIKKLLSKLGNQYSKKIEAHFFPKKDFYKNKKDPLVKEILQNGIRLM